MNEKNLNLENEDFILKYAYFEKTVEKLLDAAIFGKIEHIKILSPRIMAGSVIKGGTGFCDLILDTKNDKKF